ncbi:alanine dehydrogenase [Thiomicrorhabdus sp.]|uniref:alanine dehydrogenase n=1 Tax=Thiomicrorhabdus sp. TaxID=2039724 RepID=UPI00356B0400
MIIGVPKEIKNNEYRVGMIPANVRELVKHNHQVLVETHAADGIGFSDEDYRQAGAEIVVDAADIFKRADMIIKVKEPLAQERAMLREGQILFTYLHLAPDLAQTQDLINSKAICIAYETVKDNHGGLPLLAPMSEVAGRMSVQVGAHFLQKMYGGRGVLLAGVTGVETAKVVVIGGGTVGRNAVQVAVGLGAETVVLDRNLDALRLIEMQFGNSIKTIYSTAESLEKHVLEADVVIGAVLIPGASAPKLVTAEHIKKMKPGSVIVDVAIDQGGCTETSRPTSHENPTYIVDGVVHYCVTNMPGAVPTTSAFALNNATLPYILNLANKGYKQALLDDEGFLQGLNVFQGQVTNQSVAEALNLPFSDPRTALRPV